MAKYLDYDGLGKVWAKIKAQFATKSELDNKVSKTGDETITGTKTFSDASSIVLQGTNGAAGNKLSLTSNNTDSSIKHLANDNGTYSAIVFPNNSPDIKFQIYGTDRGILKTNPGVNSNSVDIIRGQDLYNALEQGGFVHTSGDESISGVKTFTEKITLKKGEIVHNVSINNSSANTWIRFATIKCIGSYASQNITMDIVGRSGVGRLRFYLTGTNATNGAFTGVVGKWLDYGDGGNRPIWYSFDTSKSEVYLWYKASSTYEYFSIYNLGWGEYLRDKFVITWERTGTTTTQPTGATQVSIDKISTNIAGTADKASQDGDGNTISSTYLKLSGGTVDGKTKIRYSNDDNDFEINRKTTNGAFIRYSNNNGTLGWLGLVSDGQAKIYSGDGTNSYNILSAKNVQNNLTSTSTTDVLSAAQGKALNDKFGSYLPLAGGTMTGTIKKNGSGTFLEAHEGATSWNCDAFKVETSFGGTEDNNILSIFGSYGAAETSAVNWQKLWSMGAKGLNTINGSVVINPKTYGYFGEGLRINQASDGWALIQLGGADGTTSQTGSGQWTIGRRGAAATAGYGAVGDLVLQNNGADGKSAVTITQSGSLLTNGSVGATRGVEIGRTYVGTTGSSGAKMQFNSTTQCIEFTFF